MTTTTSLPAVDCTTWCRDGDGHTDAFHPGDQYCATEQRSVILSRYPLLEASRDYMGSQLYRDNGAASPHIALTHNDLSMIELSIGEADQLAEHLIELVKAARS